MSRLAAGVLSTTFWVSTRVVLPLVLLAAIGVGILYVRLQNGPVSLKALAQPIARGIAADLPGLSVTIENAAVHLTPSKGLEFRLHNVRFADSDGGTVALAPLAAVRLSMEALSRGRIAPSGIVLIEPRLMLLYSREHGLSLSFSRTAETPAAMPPAAIAAAAQVRPPAGTADGLRPSFQAGGASAGVPGPPEAERQYDIGRTIVELVGQRPGSASTASYLKGVGLRDATLVFDNGGQQTLWRMSEAEFTFDHRHGGSAVAGDVAFVTPNGLWRLALAARNSETSDAITVEARLTDLVPRAIADTLPELMPLAAFDLPVSGRIALQLARSGALAGATGELDLKGGAVAPGWQGAGRIPIDGGRIAIAYQREARRLEIGQAHFASGSSWISLAGAVGLPDSPKRPWTFEVGLREGMIAAEEFGLAARPIEALRLRGSYDAASDSFELAEGLFKTSGGEIAIAGRIPARGSSARLSVQGRLSPMGADALKVMWPSAIVPAARRWTGQHVLQGRLVSGVFQVEEASPAERARGVRDGLRMSATIEASGIRMQPRPGFAIVEAPRALIRLENDTLEVTAPDAVIVTGSQRRLPVSRARMTAADVAGPMAYGDLTFRVLGPLPVALELVEAQAQRTGRSITLPGEGIDGRIDAQMRILVPLGEQLSADDTRVEGKGRITDGRARGVLGAYDVQGATLAFEASEQLLDAKGEMLIGGVNAKLAVKRIFAADAGEQPPLRVTATLDTADRAQLGLDINDFVQGEMPIELTVTPRPSAEPQVQVRADLTNAEIVIESLAWRKPPGRAATVHFDVVRPSKQRTELQGFKVVGEDIALAGSMVLDARNRLQQFSFPELSLHVVSRLSISGTLRAQDNVWEVTARGTTFVARDLFQSMYSVGPVRAKPLPPRKDQAGLDLRAEIDNALGFQDLSLKSVRISMSKRGGRMLRLQATGNVDGGRPLEASLQAGGSEPRILTARTEDAGQLFRLVGFYPNMIGGRMRLDVNLDGSGAADRTGLLLVERFEILGDAVPGEAEPAEQRRRRAAAGQQRPVLPFDSMRAPFSVGHGQFVLHDADLRGPFVGIVLRGNVDFGQRVLDLGGTYVPLQGLNSVVGVFPILGQILAGPRGEGVFGMTFAIKGAMDRPQMLVNPASILPGFLRELIPMTDPTPRVTPREAPPVAPQKSGTPAVRSSAPGSAPEAPKARAPKRTETPKPQVDGEGWSSDVMGMPRR